MGDYQGNGRGAGTEPVRGAAWRLHQVAEDAEQGMEAAGGEAEDPDGREGGLGEVAKHSVPRAPLVPRRGEVQRIPGATRGAALGLAFSRAPVPLGTAEAGGV